MAEPSLTLTPSECAEVLRTQRIGRIAVTERALPVILPVNYMYDGHSIVFRTRADGLLAKNCRSTVVAFEVDDVDKAGEGGVSVLMVGVADILDESERMRASGLRSAVASADDVFVRVSPGTVTGRRVGQLV